MDGVQLSQGYRNSAKRHFIFTTQSPGFPASHLINFDGMKGWNNLDFETTHGEFESGTIYWESSILTTREIWKTYLKCKCTVFRNIKQILHYKVAFSKYNWRDICFPFLCWIKFCNGCFTQIFFHLGDKKSGCWSS